jgi:hypothetical protein
VTRAVVLGLVVVLLALLAFAALTAARINALVGHLESASEASEDFVAALTEDPEGADAHVEAARSSLAAAETELQAIPLAQLESLPWLGRNVTVARTVIDEMQVVAAESAPVLADAAELIDFETLRPRSPGDSPAEWRATLEDAIDLVKAVPGAIDALGESRTAVSEIDTAGLLPPVRDAVEDVEAMLDEAYGKVAPVQKTFSDLRDWVEQGIEDFSLLDFIRSLL